ncbi:MAG: lipid A export permease/ATP-binding protein MsbA [Halioglobus sp.]
MSRSHPIIERDKSNPSQSDWHLYLRLLSYVVPYWYIFAFSILGYIVYSIGGVLAADIMQFLIDALNDPESAEIAQGGIVAGIVYKLFPNPGMEPLEFARVAVPLAAIFLAFFRAMGFFVGQYFIAHVARNLVHDLRCELFDKMLFAPSSYYDRATSGALISKITFNVEQVSGATTKALKTLIREGLLVIFLLGYMVYLNPLLSLVFLGVVPFIAIVVAVVGRHFRRYSKRIQTSMGDVTQVSNESIGAYKDVRIFGGQAHQQERFRQASDYNRVESLKMAFADALSTPVIQTMLATALGVLIWFALSPAIIEDFTAGQLVAFLVAAGQLGKPVRSLSSVQSDIQRGLAAAEDIFAQLDQDSELDAGKHKLTRARGDIELRDVSFSYDPTDAPVLDKISLDVKAGQTVALVGRSGSGKTTLVQLLARFYQPDSGEILLDGVAIADYELANLRQQMAVVSQNVTLFHDTVRANIAYGTNADASDSEVNAAIEAAYATHFIDELPAGISTVLGDDGAGLSGGQRQRIAIARALLKDAPVLILDEATSALDNESEHRIQQALVNVMRDRTTIVIAHRLSTVENADRIVVMEKGRVSAMGTHQELLAQGGLYSQLYHQEFSD